MIVLEQLARDVTGWNATAVEFFQRLVMTQYMNHLRPRCLASPDLRQWEPLERLGSAFDSIMHTVDVRRIASGRGRYNVPNVGMFLWRIDAWPLSGSPAVAVDDLRWRFNPLGIDQPLYTQPQTIADFTQLATPLNVPDPISRRVLDARLGDYYASVTRELNSLRLGLYDTAAKTMQPVPAAQVRVCNLDDVAGSWAHLPSDGTYVVDPLLGRIALPKALDAGIELRVDYHYGFSGPLGGGEYDRSAGSRRRAGAAASDAGADGFPDDPGRTQRARSARRRRCGADYRQRALRRRCRSMSPRAGASNCAPMTAAGRRWSSAASSRCAAVTTPKYGSTAC